MVYKCGRFMFCMGLTVGAVMVLVLLEDSSTWTFIAMGVGVFALAYASFGIWDVPSFVVPVLCMAAAAYTALHVGPMAYDTTLGLCAMIFGVVRFLLDLASESPTRDRSHHYT